MSVGDKVFAAIPCYHNSDVKGLVTEGTVVAIGDRDETVLKTDVGIFTYGGPFSETKVFASESEAWSHCESVLRRRGEALLAAAEKCRAEVVA